MPFSLSPSTLSLFKDCPRCFWLKFNKKIERPNGIFPSLPAGMDRILKEHFDAHLEGGMLPPELERMGLGARLFADRELLDTWRNWRKGLRWKDAGGNTLRGAVDNILEREGKLVVLDYKTRGFPLKEDSHEYYLDQLDLYNLLLRKNGFETEDFSLLLFYVPKQVHANGHVEFDCTPVKTRVDVENAERLFNDALELLEGSQPPAPENCGYCHWARNSWM